MYFLRLTIEAYAPDRPASVIIDTFLLFVLRVIYNGLNSTKCAEPLPKLFEQLTVSSSELLAGETFLISAARRRKYF